MDETTREFSGALRTRLARALMAARPQTPEALWQFVRTAYGLSVPRRAICPGHVAPLEYLMRAVQAPGRDLVVWASRGGAKTELGSVAAHLDALLRPGCQTRILGGSLDQAEKMYEYLTRKWSGVFAAMLAREPTSRRTELVNGSTIEVLTQSARSVRGQRVHRLKCDEVDEFAAEVWQAAQFVTQSGRGTDGAWIPAQMEVFSTMHRPYGPMAALVDRVAAREKKAGGAADGEQPPPVPAAPVPDPAGGAEAILDLAVGDCRGESDGAAGAGRAASALGPVLLKWCLWEVIEPCPPERSCSRCPLWPDCEGRARGADGYFPIDDAIAQRARASREGWEAEMLCLRPRADRLVFADFDPHRHVAPVGYAPSLPLYRTMDFGYANPFVCLWVQVEGEAGEVCGPDGDPDLSGVRLRVIGEYVARERAVAEHAAEMARRDPGPVLATFGDPAGWQRSDVTGTGACHELARLGLRVHTPRAGILEGVELLRRLLKARPAREGSDLRAGESGLVVDPSCAWLIRAFREYHWAESSEGARNERPAKDGADHPLDALRYLATGLFLDRRPANERRW